MTPACRNDYVAEIREQADDLIDDVLGVKLERALSRLGLNPAQVADHLLKIDPKLGKCSQNYNPSITQIVQQRQLIGTDPKISSRICDTKNAFFDLIGFCSVMNSLISQSPSLLKTRLEWDAVYWRAVNLLNLAYRLNHIGDDSQNRYSALFGVLDEIQSTKVDQVIASGQAVDTVFIGDSLMMLFEQYLNRQEQKEFTNAVFLGIGGERSDHFLYRMADHIFRLRPKTVVISTTGNDLLQGCATKTVHDNRQEIAKRLRAAGIPRIIWISLPPIINETHGTDATSAIVEENKDIQDLWKFGIEYMDAFSRLQGFGGLPQLGFYSAEGTHLTDQGYRDVWVPMLHEMGVN